VESYRREREKERESKKTNERTEKKKNAGPGRKTRGVPTRLGIG